MIPFGHWDHPCWTAQSSAISWFWVGLDFIHCYPHNSRMIGSICQYWLFIQSKKYPNSQNGQIMLDRGWEMSFFGDFEHHLQISVGDEISPVVGWCETLGHLPTSVRSPWKDHVKSPNGLRRTSQPWSPALLPPPPEELQTGVKLAQRTLNKW